MRGISLSAVLAAVLFTAGCGGPAGPALEPVTGKLNFKGGGVPAGEVVDILFDPSEPGKETKLARGKVNADGTFQLGTLVPGDGALAGKYKVYVEAFKTYVGREPLAHEKYTSAKTTPLELEVKKGQKNHFEIEIEKP